MFYSCEELESLTNISNWNISKVNNINYMFAECKRLKSLPDISVWVTEYSKL